MDERQVEQEIRGLFGVPLEEFIAARKALEDRLKREGATELAARVKSARKPSLAAWAVNQLSQTRSKDIESLIRTGEDLRDAQRRTLAGAGAASLQEVSAKRRKQIDALLQEGRKVLEGAGHSATRSQLDQIKNTLIAAATDDTVREQLRQGTLEKEAPPSSDFGGFAEMAEPSPARRREAPKGRGGAGRRAGVARADSPSSLDERRRERARQRAEELEKEASTAEAEARRLRREATEAEDRARKTNTAAARAEAKAKGARDRADKASREPR
jgi:hypothetical protein